MSVLAQAEAAPYPADERARRPRRWPVAATVCVGYAAVQVVLAGFAPSMDFGSTPTPVQRFALDGLANISALAYWALLTCAFSYLLVRAQRTPRVPPVIIAALSMAGMFVVQGSVIRELAAGRLRRGFLRWWPTTITDGWGQYGVRTHPLGPPAHTTLATALIIVGPVVDYGVLMFLTWRTARLAASHRQPQSARGADAVGVSAALGITGYVVWLSVEVATSVIVGVVAERSAWALSVAPFLVLCGLAAVGVHRMGLRSRGSGAVILVAAGAMVLALAAQLSGYRGWLHSFTDFPDVFFDSQNFPDANFGPMAVAPFVAAALTCLPVFTFPLLVRVVTWLRARPAAALVLLLAGNAIDAVATSIGLHSGTESEANPVIRAIGLPLKFVLVTVAALLLWRLRRNWLWPLAVVFSCVVAWHLVGLIVN